MTSPRPKISTSKIWTLSLSGLFIVVFSVNMAFIAISASTNPGLVTEEYEKYGLQQNKTGIQYRDQVARGWQVQLGIPDNLVTHTDTQITLRIHDKHGTPVDNALVDLASYRPSNAKKDFRTTLAFIGTGQYVGTINLPERGIWDLNVLIQKNAERHIVNQRITALADEKHPQEKPFLEKIVGFLTPDKP